MAPMVSSNCNAYLYHLSFGKYSFEAEIASELQVSLPSAFSQYYTSCTTNYISRLQVHAFHDEANLCSRDGWNYSEAEGKHAVTYVDRQHAIFSLMYGDDLHEIYVQVRKSDSKSLSLGLQHAILLALSPYCIGLHGVTLVCKDKAIILSAPSGTGKTTLSNLLKKHCAAAVINGDFALLSIENNQVFFEPTPFCGTSQRCLNYRLPLAQISFLNQSPENLFQPLNARTSLSRLLSNTFVPEWEQALALSIQNTAIKMIELLPMADFSFAPNQNAAEIFDYMVNK